MPVFRLSAKSLEDLKSIGRFTLKSWGREQRNIYLSKLDESFHILADQPHLGIARDDIRKGYRVYHDCPKISLLKKDIRFLGSLVNMITQPEKLNILERYEKKRS